MKVELIDHMGSDLSVVNAARVSFHKESKVFDGKDARLIHYLASHNHWTPFGHCFLSFRIEAPIFVARQLGKHQVGLVWNEVSRRYVDSPPEFYTPDQWRGKSTNGAKQGSSEETVVTHLTDRFMWQPVDEAYERLLQNSKDLYDRMIEQGIAPEMARMILPQSMYTSWIWSGSLMAFSRVCKLRLDSHTQKETRFIAREISNLITPIFPNAWKELLNV